MKLALTVLTLAFSTLAGAAQMDVPPPVAITPDSTTTVKQIRALRINARDTFLNDLETRLRDDDKQLVEMNQASLELRGEARENLKTAVEDARTKHKTVKNSIEAAREATPESWADARTKLALDYEGYVTALTRVESSAPLPKS